MLTKYLNTTIWLKLGSKSHFRSTRLARILRWCRPLLKPRYVVLSGLLLVLCCISLRLVPSAAYSYGSDDVAQANILYAREHGTTLQAVTGQDTWFLKFPIYIATNHLSISPDIRLFLNSLIPTVIGMTLLFMAYAIFCRQLLPNDRLFAVAMYSVALVLASLPPVAFTIFTTANSRNIELGVIIFLTSLLYVSEFGHNFFMNRRVLKYILVVLVAALVYADDPLFLYVFAIPLLATCLLRYFNGAKVKELVLLLLLSVPAVILGLVFKKISLAVFSFATIVQPSQLTTPAGFYANLSSLTSVAPQLFGVNFWGKSYSDHSNVYSALYAAILLFEFWGVMRFVKSQKHSTFRYALLALLITSPLILVVSMLLAPQDALIGRYLILTVPIALFGLPLFLRYALFRRQIVLVFSACALLFIVVMGRTAYQVATTKHSIDANYNQMVANIQKQHIGKGYGEYQFANISTFLSSQKLNILPVVCLNQPPKINFYNILVEKAQFYKKAHTSFFIYHVDDPAQCTPMGLASQLGTPKKILPVLRSSAENVDMAVYGYDIGTVMPEYNISVAH